METASSTAGGFRGALARLRSAPTWVWITILLTFGLLIFAYLQYKKSGSSASTTNAASNGSVPTDATGQPLWNTADPGAFTTGNQSELAALLAYIMSQQTPNPPPVATPGHAGPEQQAFASYQAAHPGTTASAFNAQWVKTFGKSATNTNLTGLTGSTENQAFQWYKSHVGPISASAFNKKWTQLYTGVGK